VATARGSLFFAVLIIEELTGEKEKTKKKEALAKLV